MKIATNGGGDNALNPEWLVSGTFVPVYSYLKDNLAEFTA